MYESNNIGTTIGYFIDVIGNITAYSVKATGEYTSNVIRGEENNGDNSLISLSGSTADPLVPGEMLPFYLTELKMKTGRY